MFRKALTDDKTFGSCADIKDCKSPCFSLIQEQAFRFWGNYVVVKKPFVLVLCLLLSICGAWVNAQDEPQEENSAERVSSENFLPASTTLWFSVPDILTLQTKFDQTDFGRLTHDSDMQPFIEAMTSKVRDWANKKNVRLGLTVDDISGLDSGEICVAGILPRDAGKGAKVGRGSHGLVFLVDVSESPDAARDLMKKVAGKMDDQGAEKIDMDDINGAEVAKWKWEVEHPKTGRKRTYTTLHTLTDGWLIASDNETIFRDVIRRVKNPADGVALDTLNSHPPFVKIQAETKIENADPHIRFFVDPFGYMKLADAIAAEDQEFRQKKDNIGEVLESQGFDAIKGFGGCISFAAEKKDVIYRAFVYTPPRDVGEAQKRARGILDFRNKSKVALTPEPWVVGDGAGYATFTWDASSAFNNVGEVFDAFVDPEVKGDWDNIVNGVSADMDVDLRAMVGKLANRFTIMSAIKHPIDVRSERVVIGLQVTGDAKEFFDMTVKLLPEGDVIEVDGHDVIVIDTTVEEEGGLYIEDDPVFGGGEAVEDDEEEVELFNLFEKRYFTMVPAAEGKDGGYLLVCNDQDYLMEVVKLAEKGEESELAKSDDYQHVQSVLDSLIDTERVSIRQFGRTDKIIEANYEMMRKGRMAESQTVLARVLNEVFKDPDADPDAVRSQQIDGSTLPADFSKSVAPFFGPAGWAMETKDDGWRITGVVLKKNGGNEVVQKPDEEKSRR